jgi:long-chain acyl-CoA synthetase
MRILKDFKIPDFKFPKFKMKGISNIEEMKVDYESLEKEAKNRGSKKAKNYEITDYKTIKEIFERSTTLFAENTLILEKYNHKEPFKEIKYKEFRSDVISLGTALNNYLKIKDTPVIIIGENTYHWYVSYMALLCGSGIAVPVDKELPENEIINVINRSKATAVIYSTKKKEVIKKIMDSKQTKVKYFIQMNSDEKLTGKNVGLDYLIKQGNILLNNGDDSYSKIEIDPNEFRVLIFTSGTTSNSKGVMICNRNLAANINAVSAYVKLETWDRLFSILPLHHTYESTIGFLLPFASGASISVCSGLKYIIDDLKETKPTGILTVPLLLENIYKKINSNIKKSKKEALVTSMIHVTNALKGVGLDIKRKVFDEIHESLGGNIRIVVTAAAPIEPKIGKWFEDIGITFLQGYGLTETAPIAALTPEYKTKVGSAGKPVICADIKIDNPNEKGEGEILIKSETLMLGYYEDEEATKNAIIDGYFHSGDVGYLDNDGYLYITGRCKNVIVTQNGKNIYPEEIETLLQNIEEIKEVIVYGKKDENEKKNDKELVITARVVPNYTVLEKNNGKNLTEEQIHSIIWEKIKEVNRQLTSYKAIKCLELKDEEFEKTTTMKIKRYVELNNKK